MPLSVATRRSFSRSRPLAIKQGIIRRMPDTVHPLTNSAIPLIDVGPLVDGHGDKTAVACELNRACRDCGFFYIINHGVSETLGQQLEALSRHFFDLDLNAKMSIRMSLGGRAWRGYFPVGGELTSGRPDLKEGLYFGEQLTSEDGRVKARTPLHGANLFPPQIPAFRETVLEYIGAMTCLGHHLMKGIALGLGLDESYFHHRYIADPLVLFRIFNYPAADSTAAGDWGVGEHTDYGLLTILRQDQSGGLQVKSQSRWIEAPPVPGSFVCNIGDMLDRMTGGLFRSTPHRVRNPGNRPRLSFPFFFDPNFNAEVKAIDVGSRAIDDSSERWDARSVHEFSGTYGEYLMGKIGKVFPELFDEIL